MLFNSLEFGVFFALVLPSYYLLRGRRRAQNWLLLVASYVFYGWWDWRFLGLIAASTVVDFVAARRIADGPAGHRKRWLVVSLAMNLGALSLFKYFDFFTSSAIDALHSLGLEADPILLHITLPVGISFYTFQTLGYTVDVYRGDAEPCRRLDDFALYVAFFPQLVAGPIERAPRLLRQIANARRYDPGQIELGVWLILWGLYKKMVIADQLAPIADRAFAGEVSPGLDVLLGALAFTFQIYGDFSGYTDIARGVAKVMGFDLTLNFRIPYLAVSPSDFWRRWHISLSTWLRDYLYIPLGGNRGGTAKTYRNLMITMILGGLWHGAAYNFVLWGVYHGLLLVSFRPFETRFAAMPKVAKWAIMFVLTVIGWIIFRAPDLESLGFMFGSMGVAPSAASLGTAARMAARIAPLLLMWFFQARAVDLAVVQRLPTHARVALYVLVAVATFVFGKRGATEFIYFQF